MKPITIFVTVLISLLIGCSKNAGKTNDIESPDDVIKKHYRWDAGQEVELVGAIWPSKSPGGAKFHIRCSDNRNPHLISDKIDQLNLKRGTVLWVKGNIEYIRYDRPNNADKFQAFVYPQIVCYLHVKDFKIIEDSNQATQQTQQAR